MIVTGRRIFSLLYLIWCLTVFFTAMLLVFPFILIIPMLIPARASQRSIFFFLRLWAILFCTLTFFRVQRVLHPDYKPGESCIYVANHSSYLDSVAVVMAISGSFRPLGKIEMVKVPVFGAIYRRVVVLIDRASKESRAESMERLKDDLRQSQSILIFPEGTMNRGNSPLTEFYDGAFRLAIETNTPIVPLVILNARHLLPRNRPLDIRPGKITCMFGKPVSVQGLTLTDLKQRVFTQMKNVIQEKEV